VPEVATIGEGLAALNAGLNATATILLLLGRGAIRQGRRGVHKRCMVAAFCTSCLFLTSYLVRMALTGAHPFAGTGALRTMYFCILFSHMTLAATVPFLAVRTLQHARREHFDAHRRIARITFPVWLYVSVTGVVIYGLLYHWPEAWR